MKICSKCLKAYKKSTKGRKAKKHGSWGKGYWPPLVYHNTGNRLCERHHIDSIIQGAKRRARKINATPTWANAPSIKSVYEKAYELTYTTGIRHEVDHIIPLNGKNVCGLHVETNLQILKFFENRKKSNHFKPSMLGGDSTTATLR